MRYHGKIALVTGGRSGIGQAIAQRLSEEGARVITTQRGADEHFTSISADLRDPLAPQKVIDEIKATYGQLDLLVNNAGIMAEKSLDEMSFEAWQETLQVNLSAPFLFIKYALPLLRLAKGAIVNIGSIEGLGANPLHAAYAASKAGLHGLTKAVAVDEGPHHVRCNAIAPGWIDTDLNLAFVKGQDNPEEFKKGLSHIHPVRRTGTTDDVAALAAFLGSQEAGFITGEIYRIDGGRMTKLSLPQ